MISQLHHLYAYVPTNFERKYPQHVFLMFLYRPPPQINPTIKRKAEKGGRVCGGEKERKEKDKISWYGWRRFRTTEPRENRPEIEEQRTDWWNHKLLQGLKWRWIMMMSMIGLWLVFYWSVIGLWFVYDCIWLSR